MISLTSFDENVHHCFAECTAVDPPIHSASWRQACLSPRLGGLGLWSTTIHSSAVYLSSVFKSAPEALNISYASGTVAEHITNSGFVNLITTSMCILRGGRYK